MTEIDYVGQPLNYVEKELKDKGVRYTLTRTNAPNPKFSIDNQNLYVIRQQLDDDILHLTVAAKMGKEVF